MREARQARSFLFRFLEYKIQQIILSSVE